MPLPYQSIYLWTTAATAWAHTIGRDDRFFPRKIDLGSIPAPPSCQECLVGLSDPSCFRRRLRLQLQLLVLLLLLLY